MRYTLTCRLCGKSFKAKTLGKQLCGDSTKKTGCAHISHRKSQSASRMRYHEKHKGEKEYQEKRKKIYMVFYEKHPDYRKNYAKRRVARKDA